MALLKDWTKSLRSPIRWGVIRLTQNMLDPISFHECFKLRSYRLQPIFWYNLLREDNYAANRRRNSWSIAVAVVELISKTSGHSEWAATIIRNMRPWNEPVKSTWILCHGLAGHIHGCSSATIGLFLDAWHNVHDFVKFSFSESR